MPKEAAFVDLLKAPPMPVSLALRAAALDSRAWPFEEARKILKRVEKSGQKSVLFETGYGPSGLPHIGTFGEVARTTMVRKAFSLLSRFADAPVVLFR